MCVGEGWGLGSGAFYTPEKTGTIPEAILDQQPLSNHRDGAMGPGGGEVEGHMTVTKKVAAHSSPSHQPVNMQS